MKPKTMILMVIAVACGLGASWMTSQLLANRELPQELPKVPVLVAKKPIEMSTPVKNAKDLFEVKMITQGDEPKNAVADLEKVKDKYIKHRLPKNHQLTLDDLTDESTTLPVPEGYRAVGIRVNTEAIAGGFAAQPGSRVDLIYNIRKGNDEETHSGVLLEDVLVLAADQIKDRVEGSGAVTASVVTLALKPKDVLKVDLALAQSGQLRLVLRKFGDKSLADKTTVTLKEIISNRSNSEEKDKAKAELAATLPPAATPAVPPVPEPPKVAPPRPKYQKHVVTIVKGNQTTRQIFFLNEAGEVVDEETVRQEREEAEAQPSSTPPAAVNPSPPAAPAAPHGDKGRARKNVVGV